jgi:hypothetical protein
MFFVSKTLSGYLLNLPRYWLADNLVSVMPLRKKLIMNTPHVTLKPIKAEVQIRLISGLLKIAYNPTAEAEATRVLISKQTFPCVAYKVRLNISASYNSNLRVSDGRKAASKHLLVVCSASNGETEKEYVRQN